MKTITSMKKFHVNRHDVTDSSSYAKLTGHIRKEDNILVIRLLTFQQTLFMTKTKEFNTCKTQAGGTQ
jgi:hypothetical protein